MVTDTILVPTDFSPRSDLAMRRALDLVPDGGRVLVLHTFVPPVYALLDGFVIPSAVEMAAQLRDANDALDLFCARFERPGVRIEARLVDGPPADEIVRIAREEHCTMIVLATHGRAGFRRMALGSVAEKVIRTSDTPVLTVRVDASAETALGAG